MKKMINLFFASLLLTALMFVPGADASAVNPFSVNSGYETLVLGDFNNYGGSDVHGSMAIAGDVNMHSWFTFGSRKYNTETNFSIVVGGAMNKNGHSMSVERGNAYFGSIEGEGNIYFNGNAGWSGSATVGGASPFDFATAAQEAKAISSFMGLLESTDYTQSGEKNNTFNVDSTPNTLQVVNIILSDLLENQVSLNDFFTGIAFLGLGDGATLLVNIIGDAENNSLKIDQFNQNNPEFTDRIVLNLINIDELTIVSKFNAGLYAPETNVTLINGGSLEGVAVVNNLTFNPGSESHAESEFKGEIPFEQPNPNIITTTPEPATMLLIGLGALGLPITRFGRRKKS